MYKIPSLGGFLESILVGGKLTVTVSKSTIVENIFKNFYDLINASSSFTNKIYPAFPEGFNIDDKADYPVFILESARLNEEQFTFGKSYVDGTIVFDIYTSDAKTCDEYTSDAKDKIETDKYTLATLGLKMVFLDSNDKEVVQRGKINVHHMTLRWRFRFYYDKTSAY